MPVNEIITADCLDWMRTQPDRSVDLVFTSPPYEAARTYGIDFNLRGQDWADWCKVRFMECLRISRGLVAWVIEGQTRNYRYSAAPLLLMADLHRAGANLRKPPIFSRVGIPGSGGPDWLRNDYEFIICATPPGKLPWSHNTACGHAPKRAQGGKMSNRHADGQRANSQQSNKNPRKAARGNGEPSPKQRANGIRRKGTITRGSSNGDTLTAQGSYNPPVKANPGNIIRTIVGGGVMGSRLAHENEAPFPEAIANFFIISFCPPGGKVLDPFCGSGTTCAVAKKTGRNWIGIDIRESQVELTRRRLEEVDLQKAG